MYLDYLLLLLVLSSGLVVANATKIAIITVLALFMIKSRKTLFYISTVNIKLSGALLCCNKHNLLHFTQNDTTRH